MSRAARRADVVRAALVAAAGAIAVAGLGGLATDLGPWYQALKQPPWKPDDRWFGPAWTTIFTLTAWAGARLWLYSRSAAQKRLVIGAFAVNGLLNVAWSWLFFAAHRPDWAFAEVVPFWLSIAALVALAARIDRVALLLLLPYLAWVAFAAVLNFAVMRLNPV